MDVAQFIKSISSRELADLLFYANQESTKRAEKLVCETVLTPQELILVGLRDKVKFAKAIRDRLGSNNIRLFDAIRIFDSACHKVPAKS